MSTYNLAAPEEQVVVTWLFEPLGYLDAESIALGQTGREALTADPGLDVTQWVRDNGSRGLHLDAVHVTGGELLPFQQSLNTVQHRVPTCCWMLSRRRMRMSHRQLARMIQRRVGLHQRLHQNLTIGANRCQLWAIRTTSRATARMRKSPRNQLFLRLFRCRGDWI